MVVRMDQAVNRRVATQVLRRLSESEMDNANLAERVGISEATLVRRLTSKTSFTVDELARAAVALQCSLSDLIPAVTDSSAVAS
ncbi:hypothetical protein C1Y40_04157 [Mycobacterium talmoniae]|uniref:HTH cro/C1-type domain-containing protein n=1 Tax=Mycobacterium talmoniae TaxID=1858794 RepID=A0A2S8BGB4_9MYCO|nr:hypothetical protein C1Y40_04157 [Mycobacterium talmoniae]